VVAWERIISVNPGVALEDITTGKILYERAKSLKIGMELPL
jgi:ornithine cyclodeaminase/alanine dehydrogenase-like protein (mu-crystallin family)